MSNPSNKWTEIEKYVYGEHKASCRLENGGFPCTCGKQKAAAELAALRQRVAELEKALNTIKDSYWDEQDMRDTATAALTPSAERERNLETVLLAAQKYISVNVCDQDTTAAMLAAWNEYQDALKADALSPEAGPE